MSIDQNKAVLQSGAEAFNDPARRSGWFDIHDLDVVAEGLAPQPLNLDGLNGRRGEFRGPVHLRVPKREDCAALDQLRPPRRDGPTRRHSRARLVPVAAAPHHVTQDTVNPTPP